MGKKIAERLGLELMENESDLALSPVWEQKLETARRNRQQQRRRSLTPSLMQRLNLQ